MGKGSELKFAHLKRRSNETDDTFASTARHISELHENLLAFQARMEQRFDRILGSPGQASGRFDKIEGKFDRIERELRGLRADIPKVIRRALREARRGVPSGRE